MKLKKEHVRIAEKAIRVFRQHHPNAFIAEAMKNLHFRIEDNEELSDDEIYLVRRAAQYIWELLMGLTNKEGFKPIQDLIDDCDKHL